MKNYQIWNFCFIAQNTKKYINVLTGTGEESKLEVSIPCFNGLAYFKIEHNNVIHYYFMSYPKISKLNSRQKDVIENYCGYTPSAGEYGVIAGALGICIETDKATFEYFSKKYPLPRKAIIRLGW